MLCFYISFKSQCQHQFGIKQGKGAKRDIGREVKRKKNKCFLVLDNKFKNSFLKNGNKTNGGSCLLLNIWEKEILNSKYFNTYITPTIHECSMRLPLLKHRLVQKIYRKKCYMFRKSLPIVMNGSWLLTGIKVILRS